MVLWSRNILPDARGNASWRHGFFARKVETRFGVGGPRHVGGAIEVASPGEVVRGGGAGTSVLNLYGNGEGI